MYLKPTYNFKKANIQSQIFTLINQKSTIENHFSKVLQNKLSKFAMQIQSLEKVKKKIQQEINSHEIQ